MAWRLLLPLLALLPRGIRSDSLPKWEWEPAELLELAEEESAELECPARGRPQPLIRWSFNAVPFHQLSEDPRRVLLDQGRLLRVVNLKRDLDMGLYQCNATNSLGHLAAATFLNVQAFAPRFGHDSQRVWKVLRNSRVDLNCDVQAAPRALVRWVDANDTDIQPVPGKLELLANHTLRIHSASSTDDGFYYCNVSNKYGLNRAMNRLEVFTPTFFLQVPQPPQLSMDAFGSVQLRCHAVADPRLALDYVWTRNGRPTEERPMLAEDGSSVLSLPKVRGRASGRIECAAVTDVDVKVAAMELLVRDVPEAPALLQIDCSSGQHALLVWRRPADHGSALTAFTVEAKARQQWEQMYEERLGEEVARKQFHRTVVPLRPWSNYNFRLVAHNEHGPSEAILGPASGRGQECATPEAVPYQNPGAVSAQGTEPDNLVVRWLPLARTSWNAPGLRYLVRYRRADLEAAPWNEFFVEDSFANQTVIREQPTYRPYQVQVRAVNSRGFSALEPDTVLGWSGEDVPTEAPRDLRLVQHHNFSAVSLQWEPVPASSLRGRFRGYRVCANGGQCVMNCPSQVDYWHSPRPLFVSSLFVSNASTKLTVTGLEALRNYTAKVHALNGQYESGPSQLLQFQTREGAPSKVHNLRVHAVGARSVLATWEPPQHANGLLRGYFVAFENGTSGLTEETYVLHRQQFYLHELLSPEMPFRVAVWAETGGGEGPRLWRHTRTWPLRDPDPPLFSVRSASASALRIQWLPAGNGTNWRMAGTSFAVNYSRQGSSSPSSDEWTQTEWIRLPQTQLELEGLEEGTDYVLVGLAREGPKRQSASKPFAIRTDSSRTTPPFSQERLRSAAWFLAVLIASALVLALAAGMCVLAQRSAINAGPSLAAIQLRDKKFGLAFRVHGRTEGAAEEASGEWSSTELQDSGSHWTTKGIGAAKATKLMANKQQQRPLTDDEQHVVANANKKKGLLVEEEEERKRKMASGL